MVVASFHLVRYAGAAAPRRLAAVPVDRRRLRRVDGLRFARLLGTGAGARMSRSADLRRWATIAVWDDVDAHDRFRLAHPLATTMVEDATEAFHVLLQPIGSHGTWDGRDPFDGHAVRDEPDGPVAVLTRATVRWRQLSTFLRAVPAAEADAHRAVGLLAMVGIGEYPIKRQATFSLWRDAGSLDDFAYRSPGHADVVRRTRDEGWYGEELFARFRPVAWSGTWEGRRPLG